jgi:NAD(P)-dependent dehydrogenase (short-subunit alcohol dehydrogenase family)
MKDRFSLAGRVALITGASSGLGRHFARVLAGAGARVVVGARRRERLDELVSELADEGSQALAVDLDVTDAASVEAAFEVAQTAFGAVDVLVNNAGVAWSGRLEQMTDPDWQATLDTNVTAVHRVAAEMARRLQTSARPGAIVNIASILGIRVGAGTAAYNASKAAVIQLTKSQALEWARLGIRVNALCPGYFPTEINAGFLESDEGKAMLRTVPLRRAGELDELSGPLLLLASGAGAYMTGAVVPVDGGHLCSSL